MAECKKCGVHITDDTDRCPFCRCVLEDDGIKGVNVYPDVENKVKVWRHIRRIVLFLSICAMGGMFIALYMGADIFNWTVVVGLILLYVNLAIYMTITERIGYMFKTLFLTLTIVLILIGIDYFTGNNRWSYDYILPTALMFLDFSCVLLMLINRRNWDWFWINRSISFAKSLNSTTRSGFAAFSNHTSGTYCFTPNGTCIAVHGLNFNNIRVTD